MGGSPPPVQQAPVFKEMSPEVADAIKRERDLQRRRKGRSSTILTGGGGDASNVPEGGATMLSGAQ